MHTLKTLLIVAVLSAVAYGVYVALTGTPDSGPPPGVAEEGYDAAPTVELPATKKGPQGRYRPLDTDGRRAQLTGRGPALHPAGWSARQRQRAALRFATGRTADG